MLHIIILMGVIGNIKVAGISCARLMKEAVAPIVAKMKKLLKSECGSCTPQ